MQTTILDLFQWKASNHKFAALTAYDFSFARLFYNEGIQVLLVGDSLGMTLQGYESTLFVRIKDIAYHTSAVRRGAPKALLLADLPFMSYSTPLKAFKNAEIVMRAGANLVKLEGGEWLCHTIKMLTERSVPVCGHLGLTPQSINILGKYKVQGRNKDSAEKLISDAIALESAGAKLIVLECVPFNLAKIITTTLTIPVIGIGCGNVTDGQILVMHDLLGITGNLIPRFAKNFLKNSNDIRSAIRCYIDEVQSGKYPSLEHTFQ
ncbi:3-methyl-2-oxobutanoate hydroxymethyltransferase [Candidatus Ishikawaella capsulata Mpkobe]|uniref:3-methyl-2-oxobutanoate hydroxymethyltransferase n=2 Tax=Candidatus Ishikawella capsulata TaxID=168169 RepID=C5WCL6_9ENTR|nr:3-methyl-2-oxobutanoate hydroxymethyltransferase [Candidatus Ishikawaella capsulata Mpkobe]